MSGEELSLILKRKTLWLDKASSGSKLRDKAGKGTAIRSTMKKRWERLRDSVRGRIPISSRPRRAQHRCLMHLPDLE